MVFVVSVEFMYMVIFFYDDVVDESDMCCGKFVVCKLWGN